VFDYSLSEWAGFCRIFVIAKLDDFTRQMGKSAGIKSTITMAHFSCIFMSIYTSGSCKDLCFTEFKVCKPAGKVVGDINIMIKFED